MLRIKDVKKVDLYGHFRFQIQLCLKLGNIISCAMWDRICFMKRWNRINICPVVKFWPSHSYRRRILVEWFLPSPDPCLFATFFCACPLDQSVTVPKILNDTTAFQYNHSFGFQKPMKVKVVKWGWKKWNEHDPMHIYHKQCEIIQKIEWNSSNGQIHCFHYVR